MKPHERIILALDDHQAHRLYYELGEVRQRRKVFKNGFAARNKLRLRLDNEFTVRVSLATKGQAN